MTSHPYIFNKTLEQLRLVGARGGRAFGRNERARRALIALMPASSEASTPRLPARQTTADAIASLDRQFSWLRRRQIFVTSKFSLRVWFTQKRHLLAKRAILPERVRSQPRQRRLGTSPGSALERCRNANFSVSRRTRARMVDARAGGVEITDRLQRNPQRRWKRHVFLNRALRPIRLPDKYAALFGIP